MYSSIAERLADRLGKKLAKKTPFRSDFVVADFKVLDEDRKSAKVLIQYDGEAFGAPSKEDIVGTLTYLYRAHDGRPRIVVDVGSIKAHPQFQAVSAVVQLPAIRRPFEDVRRFKLTELVANTVFLGENMSDTWAIAKGEDDNVYIERVEKDDIDKIIRERSKANAFRVHSNRSSITLARVEASLGNDLYTLGDWVKCSHGSRIQAGEILGLTETGAQVRFKDGSHATVALSNLHGLVKAAEELKNWNREALKEYYRKAYGYDDADLDKLVQPIG